MRGALRALCGNEVGGRPKGLQTSVLAHPTVEMCTISGDTLLNGKGVGFTTIKL